MAYATSSYTRSGVRHSSTSLGCVSYFSIFQSYFQVSILIHVDLVGFIEASERRL
jgi:hypothetical protein